jgi:hypothetical protein
MHTHGIEERPATGPGEQWFVRSECCGCHWRIGLEGSVDQVGGLVDRLMWTDEASYHLSRTPPWVQELLKPQVEEYARSRSQRVVTVGLLEEARRGGPVAWDPEAAERLNRVPAAVRVMARAELERTALERGQPSVTVALMEETKARYFGLAGQKT